jgi:hypothetical protein
MPTLLSCLMLVAVMPAGDEVPAVGRPSRHFYGAVGEHVRVTMRASPLNLRVEDPLVLTLTVSGASNPDQIERPDLRQLDDYPGLFYIDDLPDEGTVAAGERRFRYRLRPKSLRARELPPILFLYYQPKLKYFAATATEETVVLNVSPRSPVESTDMAPERPDFLFEVPPASQFVDQSSEPPGRLLFLAIWLAPALVFVSWLLWWRWRNPAGVRLAQLRRLRVVRHALDELDRLGLTRAANLADRVAAITLGVLRDRHGIPQFAATPQEIALALRRGNVAEGLVDQVESFFRACDAGRFGPPGTDTSGLPAAAKRLILTVEEST